LYKAIFAIKQITMKYCFFLLLIFTQGVKAQSSQPKENVFSNKDIKHTKIYVLKYYYPEEPDKIIYRRAYGRSKNKDGSFCLIDYDPATNKPIYSSCFDPNGIPTQTGNDKEPTKIYRDSIRLNFKGKDTTILINTVKELKDPTTLWFWKHTPKVNETVTVGGIRKNFITKSIDLVSVAYTYMGKERINVFGKIKTCYLVKSIPLNGSKGVYDERWFDQKGMLVKEKHVVGKDGTRIAELSEIKTQ
jgi:hypothetical protein